MIHPLLSSGLYTFFGSTIVGDISTFSNPAIFKKSLRAKSLRVHALQHHKDTNPVADKVPLQLVLDDLNKQDNLEGQSCQVTGGNISVGNISGSVGQIGNTVENVEEPFPCDLSPIPFSSESDSFINDTYHPIRTNVHLYDSI
ncbi:hypothetical protein BC941DRAFT_474938 [Chlamydoabsidia padenii]|nr:hypothetical protein BC941DRAFT_474938 [Chlamydoabsidia padenii]